MNIWCLGQRIIINLQRDIDNIQLHENGVLLCLSTLIEPTAPIKPTIMNKVEEISNRTAAFEVHMRRYNIAGRISVSGMLVNAPQRETKFL